MTYDFSGKRVLVTGAGRGIGREVAKELAKHGAEVIALSKTQENLDSLKLEVPSIQILCIDISDWNTTRSAIDNLGIIDLLVNNAGILLPAVFEGITEENFNRTFDVNVKAMINISQVVVKKLKENKKEGSIVNLASISSWVSYTGEGVYCLSKATVDRLTKLMAKELGPHKIRVNSVNPTWVTTEMIQQVLTPEDEAQAIGRIPLGKFCSPRNISDAVLFLLSDKASMINGVSLLVDGGELIG